MLVGLPGCATDADGLRVGDCVKVAGPADRPETREVDCGSADSNFKVVAVVEGAAGNARCPSDVDSSFSSRRGGFTDKATTVCMDIDWVVGGCMSVDPEHDTEPVRVECTDAKAPHRQRAAQILTGVANVDQCASGQGYAYREREFTICVEDIA